MSLFLLVFLGSFVGVGLVFGFGVGLLYAKSYYDKSETNRLRKRPRFQLLLSRLFYLAKTYYFSYSIVYMEQEPGSRALEEQVKKCQNGNARRSRITAPDRIKVTGAQNEASAGSATTRRTDPRRSVGPCHVPLAWGYRQTAGARDRLQAMEPAGARCADRCVRYPALA